jgi:hypothetical protein
VFDAASRYAAVPDATMPLELPDGSVRTVAYKRRRFIAPAGGDVLLVEHVYAGGERLDNLTARYVGDPTQFWRICDANEVLRPEELTEEVGRAFRITMPRL